jgi:hypothetical protein
VAKPRTAPPSAPKNVQDSKPADAPGVTEVKQTAPSSPRESTADVGTGASSAPAADQNGVLTETDAGSDVDAAAGAIASSAPVTEQNGTLAEMDSGSGVGAASDEGASSAPVAEQSGSLIETVADPDAADGAAAVSPAIGADPNAAGAQVIAWYEVLTPFKFGGNVVKPPKCLFMFADEAAEYQAAGVLGKAPVESVEQE